MSTVKHVSSFKLHCNNEQPSSYNPILDKFKKWNDDCRYVTLLIFSLLKIVHINIASILIRFIQISLCFLCWQIYVRCISRVLTSKLELNANISTHVKILTTAVCEERTTIVRNERQLKQHKSYVSWFLEELFCKEGWFLNKIKKVK